MAFTKFLYDDPQLTREQVMAQLIMVANELNMPDKRAACIIAGITISVEAGVEDNDPPYERRFWCPANPTRNPESLKFKHDSYSDDNRSVGYFQQQKGPNGELWWGTTESMMILQSAASTFMSRLKKLPGGYSAINAPTAGKFAQTLQQSAHPERYANRFDDIVKLYDRVSGGVVVNPGGPVVKPAPWPGGDPVWLKDVVAAEGVKTAEYPNWLNRGHGDFGKIWGIVIHHTGGNNTPAREIAEHPSLGLCSQIHLAKDGTATMCGVGIAYHAGYGSYPGLPEDAANGVTIGIECVNLPPQGQPHRSGWTEVQYIAIVRTCAAILRRLGHNADRLISHKEWAGRKQGKWDPGSIDMDIMRADVQRQIDSKTGEIEDMAQVPQEQWDRVYRELTQDHPSRSIYRKAGEGKVDTWAGFTLNQDAMLHQELVERLAVQYGDDDAITRIVLVATENGADPNDLWAITHARQVLEKVRTNNPSGWETWTKKHTNLEVKE